MNQATETHETNAREFATALLELAPGCNPCVGRHRKNHPEYERGSPYVQRFIPGPWSFYVELDLRSGADTERVRVEFPFFSGLGERFIEDVQQGCASGETALRENGVFLAETLREGLARAGLWTPGGDARATVRMVERAA